LSTSNKDDDDDDDDGGGGGGDGDGDGDDGIGLNGYTFAIPKTMVRAIFHFLGLGSSVSLMSFVLTGSL